MRLSAVEPLLLVAGLLAATVGADDKPPAAAKPIGEQALIIPFSALPSFMSMGGSGGGAGGPEYPPIEKVLEGYEKVPTGADGAPPMYTLYVRRRDNQIFAQLPETFEFQRYFIALTLSSGTPFAGLQSGEHYVRWKQIDRRLALIEPQVDTRSTGDRESQRSVERLYTDRVLLDVPVVTMTMMRQPVIDLRAFFLDNLGKFFGNQASGVNGRLAVIKKVKAFPRNIEVAFEAPNASGKLQTFHFSFSVMPQTSYRPREADPRIGYFTTSYVDLGKFNEQDTHTRFINRWQLEKADPNLKISPPKEPIVYYIEHTTPLRYRRWVRNGVLYWNQAFEKVGISNAIEVYLQDETTGAHMDKDPEDVRYNFVRWLNNGVGLAIGPSRVNPMTGQILDADIVLTDGWIRAFQRDYTEVLPQLAMEGMSAETMAWLQDRPEWDPRLRLVAPSQRQAALAGLQRQAMGFAPQDPLSQALNRRGAYCIAADHMAMQLDTLRMTLEMAGLDDDDALPAQEPAKADADKKKLDDEKKKAGEARQKADLEKQKAEVGKAGADVASKSVELEKQKAELEKQRADAEKKKADADGKDPKDGKKVRPNLLAKRDDVEKVDGMPTEFLGPLLADLVAHEVGHTLGLRHNFKASSIYSLAEINSDKVKGKKPFAGSVMDYMGVNINMGDGPVQGDWAMTGVGPYDQWAIEYGYTSDNDLKPILARVAEPELLYGTDEDTIGSDPLARRYDFSKNPLDYAKSRMKLARYHRERLIEKFVKDGESWSKARRGYEMTLGMQTQMINQMAAWIGGAFVYRDKKGDPKGRAPLEVVPAAQQREALDFVIEAAFKEDCFGLTPDLLRRFGDDKWSDIAMYRGDSDGAAWPIHDRVLGIQASALTLLMNPQTLRRVYDNELRTAKDADAVTLPELLDKITKAVWSELDAVPTKSYAARDPMISSLRRNLQREHLDRLTDLLMPKHTGTAASKPISNLAVMHLRQLQSRVAEIAGKAGDKMDPYTKAHLMDAEFRIKKSLDAQYVFDMNPSKGGGGIIIMLGADGRPQAVPAGTTSFGPGVLNMGTPLPGMSIPASGAPALSAGSGFGFGFAPDRTGAEGENTGNGAHGFWAMHPAGCLCGQHQTGPSSK